MLKLLIIHGTNRPNNQSQQVARLVTEYAKALGQFEATLVGPEDFSFGVHPETTKDERYSDLTKQADCFIIVTPEYNHSIPGILKTMLDSEYDNYAHKACGLVGVSSGLVGGARALNTLLIVCHELGLLIPRKNLLVADVKNKFDEKGNLIDSAITTHMEKFFEEFTWLTKSLTSTS